MAVCVPPVGEVVGNVACYKADFRDGHARISAQIAPWARSPATFESIELFCAYLFAAFEFRKLYLDVLQPNLSRFATIVDYVAVQEARFVDDVRLQGQWVDRLVFAIWRDRFDEVHEGRDRIGSAVADKSREGRAEPSPEWFSELLRAELRLSRLPQMSESLTEDLALDSIQMSELWMAVEDLAGHEVAPEAMTEVRTVSDLYHLVRQLLEH